MGAAYKTNELIPESLMENICLTKTKFCCTDH